MYQSDSSASNGAPCMVQAPHLQTHCARVMGVPPLHVQTPWVGKRIVCNKNACLSPWHGLPDTVTWPFACGKNAGFGGPRTQGPETRGPGDHGTRGPQEQGTTAPGTTGLGECRTKGPQGTTEPGLPDLREDFLFKCVRVFSQPVIRARCLQLGVGGGGLGCPHPMLLCWFSAAQTASLLVLRSLAYESSLNLSRSSNSSMFGLASALCKGPEHLQVKIRIALCKAYQRVGRRKI